MTIIETCPVCGADTEDVRLEDGRPGKRCRECDWRHADDRGENDRVWRIPFGYGNVKNCGLFECFHCLSRSVVWGADFSFDDYGMEGEGIIHECHCANCGADITYYISLDDPDGDGEA